MIRNGLGRVEKVIIQHHESTQEEIAELCKQTDLMSRKGGRESPTPAEVSAHVMGN